MSAQKVHVAHSIFREQFLALEPSPARRMTLNMCNRGGFRWSSGGFWGDIPLVKTVKERLRYAPRYRPAMAVRGDAAAFALQVMPCGYSTNRPPFAKTPPYHADELMELVRAHNLAQYDLKPTP